MQKDPIKGLVISITSNNFTYLSKLKQLSDSIVYHLIAGVNKPSIVDELLMLGDAKILPLGYKVFGNGIPYFHFDSDAVDFNLKEWYRQLPELIKRCTFSFDNLAISQLKVKRLFTIEGWGGVTWVMISVLLCI